jgi:four helix bundle protein
VSRVVGEQVSREEPATKRARSPRPHENLDAWRVSKDLAQETYRVTGSFPREEAYGLTAQLRRAAASIPANIAEGTARRGDQETRQFLTIARGSLSELGTFLALSARFGFVSKNSFETLMRTCGRAGALLNGMIRK